MSGWIKWEKDLETDPRFLRIVRELGKRWCNAPALQGSGVCNAPAFTNSVAMGALLKMWAYADTHIRQDDTLDMSPAEIDELVGIEGFAALLPADWLRETEDARIELPGYQSHNSVEAKKKAQTAKRVAKHRATRRNADVTHEQRICVTGALPDQTRPDQDQTRPTHQERAEHRPGVPRETSLSEREGDVGPSRAQLTPSFEQFLIETYPETAHRRDFPTAVHSAMGIVGMGNATEDELRRRITGFREFVLAGGYSDPSKVPTPQRWFQLHQQGEAYWSREWAAPAPIKPSKPEPVRTWRPDDDTPEVVNARA